VNNIGEKRRVGVKQRQLRMILEEVMDGRPYDDDGR